LFCTANEIFDRLGHRADQFVEWCTSFALKDILESLFGEECMRSISGFGYAVGV
jgi:hypothetical protein